MTTTTEKVIARCVARMKETKEGAASIAGPILKDEWPRLPDAERYALALQGLRVFVNKRISASRNQYTPIDLTRKQLGAVRTMTRKMAHSIAKAMSDHATQILRSITLNINGQMRSLYEFTNADLDIWASESAGKAAAWGARTVWCGVAKQALQHAHVDTLGQLPVKARNRIALRAEKVWAHKQRRRAA